MVDHIPVPLAEWLAEWEKHGVRSERREIAASFIARGFTEDGRQFHPKAISAIAADAGVSVASANRFLAQAKRLGLLEKTDQSVSLVAGMQRTPLYRTTRPGPLFGVPFEERVPASFRDELNALLALDAMPMPSHPWKTPGPAPAWAEEAWAEEQWPLAAA